MGTGRKVSDGPVPEHQTNRGVHVRHNDIVPIDEITNGSWNGSAILSKDGSQTGYRADFTNGF